MIPAHVAVVKSTRNVAGDEMLNEGSLEHNRMEKAQEATEMQWRFEHYVGNLHLPVNEMRGKKVLDIGVAPKNEFSEGGFSEGAKKYGIEVVNLKTAVGEKREGPEVVGLAQNLPFKNESFDAVVSYYAVPHYLARDIKEYEVTFNEALRVLKSGGRAYFYPVRDRIDRPGEDPDLSRTMERLPELKSFSLSSTRLILEKE